VDFIVAGSVTENPFLVETLFGRPVRVETDAEIIAKKAKEAQKAGGQHKKVGRQKSDKPLTTDRELAKIAALMGPCAAGTAAGTGEPGVLCPGFLAGDASIEAAGRPGVWNDSRRASSQRVGVGSSCE
jgi:hypothetical protein